MKLLNNRFMKKISVFVFLFVFGLSSSIFAQKQTGPEEKRVTLSLKNQSVVEIFKAIQASTGLNFIYNDKDFSDIERLDVEAKNEKVKDLLNRLFSQKQVTFEFTDNTVVVRSEHIVSITGIVRDEKGDPLPGVAVKLKGTMVGVVTGSKGDFLLNIPIRDSIVLVFSFLGMKTKQIEWKGQSLLKIVLEENVSQIGEVVITGYQQLDRRKLTSSIYSVDMDDLIIPGATNLTQMLEGKIPDMVVLNNSSEINATPRLRIRGTSTIIGNREPLWVVDGIIVNDPVNLSPDVLNDPDYVNRIGDAISGLNPQDIERLDVLKDAAATALYGTRAANGVIVITTKKGRSGKAQVSYSSTVTFRQRPRYTDSKINLMNSKERILFSQDLVNKHYIYPSGMPLVGYEHALSNLYKGIYTQDQFQQEVAKMQTLNTNWFDLLTNDSFSQDHSLNVSGGSDKIRYYVSVGYTDEDDVINKNTNNRYTTSAKVDISLSKKVQLQFNLNGYLYDRLYNQSSLNPIDYAYNTSRAISAYNEDNSYAFYKKAARKNYKNFNILNELENSYQKQQTNGFTVTANLRYNMADWLFFNATVSGTTSNSNIEGYWGEKTYYAANLRNSEYGEVPEPDSRMPYGGELSINTVNGKSYTARIQSNINKYLGDDMQHFFNVALGGEANSNRYAGYSDIQRGYYLDRGKKFMSDIPSGYSEYISWVLSNRPTVKDSRTNLLSAYATATYSYKDYFTLNANTRYDGSNQFGSRSNEKLLPVWSVSGMANLKTFLDRENYSNWLNELNLKVSYGEQGNMLDSQSPELIIKKGSMNSYYNEQISMVDRFANPDLNWEKTRSTNVGLDISLFGGQFMVGTEYYYKNTTDAFMDKPISDVNGYTSYIVNSGTVINKGYNFNLTAVPLKLRDFRWILSGSISKIMNEMKTAPGQETYELSNFLNGTAVVKGQPVETFYSYKFVGLSPSDGGPLFDDWEDRQSELTGLGKYDTFTRILTPSGRRAPDITGSINNTFVYKSWRLNVGMYYSLGAKTRLFRLFDDFIDGYSSEMNINKELLDAWKKPGDESTTNVPAVMGWSSYGYSYYSYHWSGGSSFQGIGLQIANNPWEMYDYSDIRVVSADYLKISNISLTYEFPRRILDRGKLNRLALTIGATNLYTFCDSKLKGQTPSQGGFTEIQLSDTPTYTMGLTVDF